MAYIDYIEYENAEGELKEIYDELIGSRGKLANIHKIQSLHPKSITAHMNLYMELMFAKSPLKRYQREMIAVVVSKYNDCNYCIKHHAEALNFFWKSDEKTNKFARDFRSITLDATDQGLCLMAEKLTKQPAYEGKETLMNQLREEGLDDRAILDATLIIAYFNFVNRIVLNTGINLEEKHGGYKYD